MAQSHTSPDGENFWSIPKRVLMACAEWLYEAVNITCAVHLEILVPASCICWQNNQENGVHSNTSTNFGHQHTARSSTPQ